MLAAFDYSLPTTDRHVWLYEGVTEWSANILRLRGGVTTLEEYLEATAEKVRFTGMFDPGYSLARLSAEWSTPAGLGQYGNIYQLGALTATLLDIRLLELSGGERGLREVFLDFIEKYGVDRPFADDTFLEEFAAATHLEIGSLLAAYVLDNSPLPYADYFGKLGIEFRPAKNGGRPTLEVRASCTPAELALRRAWLRNR